MASLAGSVSMHQTLCKSLPHRSSSAARLHQTNQHGAVSRLRRRCHAESQGQNDHDAQQPPQLRLEGEDVPEALRGLTITDAGLLVDEKSGKVVNALGATRFDVAVSAMRGLLDPPTWVENSERNTDGLLIGSLKQFPTRHCFSVVGANSADYKEAVLRTVASTCEASVDPLADVRCIERLGGKYLSMQTGRTMSLWESFTRAVYKETVLVWSLGMYATGLALAAAVPRFYDKNKKELPENPPTLKEVLAGLQKRLGQ